MKPAEVLKKKIEARRKKMPCSYCDKIFESVDALLQHEETHEGASTVDSDSPVIIPKRNIPYQNK